MKYRIVVSSFAPLLTFAAVPHVSAQPRESVQAVVVRLAMPETNALTGEQIKDLISNRIIEMDWNYEPAPGLILRVQIGGGCPPKEIFASDGRWQMAICGVQSRIYKGRWTIEPYRNGHRLCVEADDYAKACRFVWKGANPDQIIMPFGMAGVRLFDDWFCPYKVKEWSGQMWLN